MRLNFIPPPFPLQCYPVVSAHVDSESDHVNHVGQWRVTKYDASRGLNVPAHRSVLLLPFALPCGPAQSSLLENKGHMDRVVQLSQLRPFQSNWQPVDHQVFHTTSLWPA